MDGRDAAMQALSDFNDALQAWGQNVNDVLFRSQELLLEIGPQGRTSLLRSPLLVGCADLVSLNSTMNKVQKDVDETEKAADEFFEIDYAKDFEKAENAKRKWVSSYANTTRNAGNELAKGPPAAQAGVLMAGATAVFIGAATTVSVISLPAILTITAVGVGTGVAVNWLWDFLTPQPNGVLLQGTPLAVSLSAGESCRFVSNQSVNREPSIFADTGVGDLHIFMEDRAPLVFENFSINSGEQVTLTIEAPTLDGLTAEALADAIEDAEVTVEEIEAEVEPEPTLEAAPTPTQQLPTEEPPADQGLTNLTATQVENAVSQFAFKRMGI